MATTFKTLLDDDIVSTRTLLHELIPITGSVVSSSVYLTSSIKSYTHGMFQSVYDFPYLSSSANQLFDMSLGLSTLSPASASVDTTAAMVKKKINIYNQMAQVLVGYDINGSILRFDKDGNAATGGDKLDSMYFLNFSRLLVKDEIKKGTFTMTVGIASSSDFAAIHAASCVVADVSGATKYYVNSPAGEYGILYTKDFTANSANNVNNEVGFVFYQAGIVALSSNLFATSGTNSPSVNGLSNQFGQLTGTPNMSANQSLNRNVLQMFASSSIDQINAGLRSRIMKIEFNNTTELNSTIHFCRINHNEFNYSSNPTYLSSSQVRVKNSTLDNPVSYITTVGLYSPDNELLAVAKLSEPLKKDPTQELILRVRLDY
jgi:hypothetical protein